MSSYRADKPIILEFWAKNVKMTLKVKVDESYFEYKLRVSHDACLVQIWWFQLKSVKSYLADKVKFTDSGQTDRQNGRPDGQTQATTKPLHQRVKADVHNMISASGSRIYVLRENIIILK